MTEQQPPPGAPAPGAGPVPTPESGTGWGAPAYPTGPAPGMYATPYGRPLHQPGTVPLRPLTLSDFFDAAFKTVRRNPKATIGMGALVTTGFLVVPFVVTIVLGASGLLDTSSSSSDPFASSTVGDVASGISSALSSILSGLAGVVVAGLIVPVVTRAAIGRKLSIGESWQQTRGRLLRLLGLTLLEALVAVVVLAVAGGVVAGVAIGLDDVVLAVVLGILLGIGAIVALLAVHVKWFQLAAPALVAEKRGVLDAVRRAGRLSSGNFWRVLGTWLLVSISTAAVSYLLVIPLALIGVVAALALPGSVGTTVMLLSNQLSSVVTGAVVAPFVGCVAVLQYLDLRFRKEGFDLELIDYTEQAARSGDGA